MEPPFRAILARQGRSYNPESPRIENRTAAFMVFYISRLIMILAALALTSCFSQETSMEDAAVTTRAADFAALEIKVPSKPAGFEKWSRTMYFDGSIEVQYEFEAEEKDSDILYMSQTFSFERKPSDRLIDQAIGNFVTNSVFKSKGIALREKAGLFSWGDDSKVYEIVNENGAVVGNRLVVARDRMLCDFTIVGVMIDEAQTWAELFTAKLDLASRYKLGFFKLEYPGRGAD